MYYCDLTYKLDELETEINIKIDALSVEEKKYVALIEELNNRENV